MQAVRAGRILAEACHLVLLVGLEVAFEPVPLGRVVVVAFPREDMRGDTVEEPTVVGNHHSAAREFEQRVFEGFQGLDVQIVGGLVEQQQVAALLQGQGQVQTVALTTGQHTSQLLLIGALEAEAGHIGAGRHLHTGHLDEVEAAGHGFPQVLVRIQALTVLVHVADFDGVADLQLAAGQRLQAHDGLEQRGLTHAVRADYADDAVARQREGHTRAHNTILVNGIGQPYSMQGYGNVMRAMGGDNLSYCLGDASKAYSGISTDPMWVEAFEAAGITQTPENGFGSTPLTLYRRHVLMLHPDIVVIYDELEAKEAVRWDWLLHSPTEFSIDSNRQTVTTCNTEKAFTATTSLFSNEQITLSQTDRFTVPPPGASDTTYPNQWHLTACINGKAKTRILAVIQIKPDNDTPVKIQRNGNILTCGYWTIEAGLDASSPAMLNVTHSMKKSSFHYGNASLVLGGQSYVPADRSSSILYDKINGEYLVMEQADHRPLSTRASSR